LINFSFVLTAAHCYRPLTPKNPPWPEVVRLGDHILNNNEDGYSEMTIRVEKIIRHERYNSHTKKNDIAVIKLAQSVS
jgi:secreted trypsin-like serine protease